MQSEKKNVSPAVVALAGWLLPGLGYWLLGERARAIVVGVTTLLLFAGGILIAGVRVIEVPGYDDRGNKILVQTGPGEREWNLFTFNGVKNEIGNKPWYVGQILMGPVNLMCSAWSIAASDPQLDYPKVKARLGEIGTLYTAVAGMLNLLAMIDSAYKAGGGET
jgi:hypothetical protein